MLCGITRDGRLELVASGAWTAPHAAQLDKMINVTRQQHGLASGIVVNMRDVEAFDTFGARLLARLMDDAHTGGVTLQVVGLSDRFVGLFEAVSRASSIVSHAPGEARAPISWFAAFQHYVAGMGRDLESLLNMLGAIANAGLQVAARPRTFRLTSAVHHLDRVGWQAVPIVMLITFLIGCIIAQQGFFHFRKFGADDYVVDMVGILVLREIGVLIVAIMVAGRSGSSYTAELGSMKMREEIDALATMGVDPIAVLLLPRIVALLCALPLLTFLGSMSALYGGGLVAWLYGGMSPDIFIARLRDAISITHFKVGMLKAPFMALIIGVVACSEGLQVRGSAESLGLRTTASVVKSIFLVIVLDGVFAIFFASIGM
jgi:phospholipid/cholesterol/gamma-HCH transport system permease protein